MNPSSSTDIAGSTSPAAAGADGPSNEPPPPSSASADLPGGNEPPSPSRPSEAIAGTQLSELNQRVRMHATRLWQLPFAYFTLVALLLSNSSALKGDMPAMATLFMLAVGTIVLWCMLGAYEGVCRGNQEIGKLEFILGLRKTVGVQPDWLEAIAMRSFKRLTWHFLPYFLLAVVSLLAVISLPFVQREDKAAAASSTPTPAGAASSAPASTPALPAALPSKPAGSAPAQPGSHPTGTP